MCAWESSNQGLNSSFVPGILSSVSCVPAYYNITTALSYGPTSQLRRLRLREMKCLRQLHAWQQKEQGFKLMFVTLEACALLLCSELTKSPHYRNGLSAMVTSRGICRELPGSRLEHGGGRIQECFMEEEVNLNWVMQGSQDFSRSCWEVIK